MFPGFPFRFARLAEVIASSSTFLLGIGRATPGWSIIRVIPPLFPQVLTDGELFWMRNASGPCNVQLTAAGRSPLAGQDKTKAEAQIFSRGTGPD